MVAGGVAANRTIRAGLEAVAKDHGIPCICPPVRWDQGLTLPLCILCQSTCVEEEVPEFKFSYPVLDFSFPMRLPFLAFSSLTLHLHSPLLSHCTDNGLMVAWTGVERLALGLYRAPPPEGAVEANVDVLPRWPIGPVDPRSAAPGTMKHIKAFKGGIGNIIVMYLSIRIHSACQFTRYGNICQFRDCQPFGEFLGNG